MKKQYYFISILLLSSILLSSCGKLQGDSDTAATPATTPVATAESNIEDFPDADQQETIETPTPKNATISREKEYSDSERNISILGLKEYDKLKTEKYTDKAKKGKRYLVLFLSVYNKGSQKDYFNVNYLTARVDGKELENTFLFNEPEGYPTIFANIAGGDTAKGFIVWEVPKDWKKFEVTYAGWRDSDGLTLDAKFTPKYLFDPDEYSSN